MSRFAYMRDDLRIAYQLSKLSVEDLRSSGNLAYTLLVGGFLVMIGTLIIPTILLLGFIILFLEWTINERSLPPQFRNFRELFLVGIGGYIIWMTYILIPSLLIVLLVGVGILEQGEAAGIVVGLIPGGDFYPIIWRNANILLLSISIEVVPFAVKIFGPIPEVQWAIDPQNRDVLFVSIISLYALPAALANYASSKSLWAGINVWQFREQISHPAYLLGWFYFVAALYGIPIVASWILIESSYTIVTATTFSISTLFDFIRFALLLISFYIVGRIVSAEDRHDPNFERLRNTISSTQRSQDHPSLILGDRMNVSTLFTGGMLMMTTFSGVTSILLTGYFMRVGGITREEPYPSFEDLSILFVDGIKGTILWFPLSTASSILLISLILLFQDWWLNLAVSLILFSSIWLGGFTGIYPYFIVFTAVFIFGSLNEYSSSTEIASIMIVLPSHILVLLIIMIISYLTPTFLISLYHEQSIRKTISRSNYSNYRPSIPYFFAWICGFLQVLIGWVIFSGYVILSAEIRRHIHSILSKFISSLSWAAEFLPNIEILTALMLIIILFGISLINFYLLASAYRRLGIAWQK